jgi:CheY-like chemotaxis protein
MSALPNLTGLTLLVVHDDIDIAQTLASFLRTCGAAVLAAVTVAGALAYVDEARKLDAVVADIAMAGIDAVELARKLRRNPTRNGLPIIGLTGHYTDHPSRQAFDAVVRKPVDLDDVASTIASLTRRT